jgi:hypothetical protein
MKRTLLAASSLALTLGAVGAQASSHREAPAIAGTPRLDGTDFYMFRSYETGRQDFVTLVADYIPLQDVYGGPNFFNLDDKAVYDINIDNRGEGAPTQRFRFRFTTTNRNIALDIGGTQVKVPFVNVGAISATDNSAQNVLQTYTLSLVTGAGANETETPITGPGGQTVFSRPIDNIGMRSVPDYGAYARSFIYPITIPGCATPGRVFVGQRKDPFVVNLAETFDLLNYTHPIGEQYNAFAKDNLADKNVTALEIEAPIACLTAGSDPVIGGWTTASLVQANGKLHQVSRLGNPLVNELVIGLADKDKFNESMPKNDLANFATYVTNPTLPAVIAGFVGGTAPTNLPRTDLVGVFVTGIGPDVLPPHGLNQPKHLVHPGEEMRLNTAVAPVPAAQQSRLGVIGDAAANIPMDVAGYPNGRRPGDDVVDISLRVVMGKLCQLSLYCTPADAPSGNQEFTDGAFVDASHFASAFPYLRTPLTGSPQVKR